MKKIIVESLDDLDIVLKIVRNLFEINGKQQVTVKNFKRDRSAEQNSLLWKWYTEIGNELGSTKEEMHNIYREKFLIGIFVRDDPEYSQMASAIRSIEDASHKQFIRTKVIALTSTTDCSVDQMREYLDNIKMHAATELNIKVSLPELKGLT